MDNLCEDARHISAFNWPNEIRDALWADIPAAPLTVAEMLFMGAPVAHVVQYHDHHCAERVQRASLMRGRAAPLSLFNT